MTDATSGPIPVVPVCGWCGEQLTANGGKFTHKDGTSTGQCAQAVVKRSRDESEKGS
jgi:hypothetical protein